MIMKKLLPVFVAALFTLTVGMGVAQADTHPAPAIEVETPDGMLADIGKHITQPPLLVNDHIYLPVRSYANLFPTSEVSWDGDNRVASVFWRGAVFAAPVEGSPYMTDDVIDTAGLQKHFGTEDIHSAPGVLIADRSYVPLRALVEALGGEVVYNDENRIASIRLLHRIDIAPTTPITYDGIDQFAYDAAPLFLAATDKNTTFSPLSLYLALSMVSQGANGTTLDEFMNVLNAKNAAALSREARSLLALNYNNDDGVLAIANSLWLDRSFAVNEGFQKRLKTDYGAVAEQINMHDKNELRRISHWIADHTNNLIQISLDPSDDVLKLVNTVYFKSKWIDPFPQENTIDAPFYLGGDEKVMVPTMRQTLYGSYVSNDLFEGALLYFKDDSRLRILLPQKGRTTTEVIANLHNMDTYTKQASFYNINWQLPRFAFSSNHDCVKSLNKLGLNTAFTPAADLSGIGNNLMISDVHQFNRIQIDETGGEAASATTIGVRATAMPPQDIPEVDFTVNRPFVFVLETKDGLPLFVGQVHNPAE